MMLVSMLRPLVERGHQVDVQLSRDTPDVSPYDYHGITVHPYRDTQQAMVGVADADVVISHLENTPRAVVLSRLGHKPFVLICHNDHEVTRTWVVDDAAAVVFNSRWMAGEMAGEDVRSLIVRPPVFADDYRTTPGDAVTLINLYLEKGSDVFWRLAQRLPDTPFLAVKGAYGEQIVKDLPNVEVVEHGADMRSVYARTRVLLVPSRYESWGRVGVEAMVSGIPVIAHPTPGLRESLGGAGTFVDVDDIDGWERELHRLLLPSAWRRASRAALRRAAELDPADDIAAWVETIERLEVAHV